jgi:hypothetical protein
MITTAGKLQIKNYLAQFSPSIAQSIAFGIGSRAETITDVSLQCEVVRNSINLTSYDFVGDRLVFRATLPADFIGTIYEVGLYSLSEDPTAGNYGSRNITTFDSATESWVDPADGVTPPTYTTTARVGADSLNHTPAASATMTDSLRGLTLDFSGNSAADVFLIAFSNANTNTSSVVVRFLTDASNYYSTTISSPVAGYTISEIQKGSFVVTGTPDWSNITEIQVATTSKSSGASNVSYDAIRVEDRDSINPDYVLVAREVLTTPITSIDGQAQDLEFSLAVTI